MRRTLLIGLGGSGGKVLKHLYELLDEKQREEAYCLYLDMDRGDTEELQAVGVKTVCISSADRVQDVAAELGADDGVLSWLPHDEHEGEFLSSITDDGASQYRYKSRLCLARYLRDSNNDIRRALTSLNTVGKTIEKESLRVMIVSSIAGGTGTGTFIDVALYLRRILREEFAKSQIVITGLFGCPDLFAHTADDDDEKENMYATAYAAVRELNAMNLVTGGKSRVSPDYGKFINIKINTRSEGKLFDSKDPEFKGVTTSKPFDQIYFVDRVNCNGGVMQDVDNYYKTMADAAYTRLYSEIEPRIRSVESNELKKHADFPTAIYGSVGYGRIIYPREDILRFLAERRTCDEITETWSLLDEEWIRYRDQRRDAARLSGQSWKADADARGQHFVKSLDGYLNRDRSNFHFLGGAIGRSKENPGYCRVDDYIANIESVVRSDVGEGRTGDGSFGLCGIPEVSLARDAVVTCYNNATIKKSDKPVKKLEASCTEALSSVGAYVKVLQSNILGQAMVLADAIMPVSKDAMAAAEQDRSNVNLRFGLLQAEREDVHPLAARYLLYLLRQKMKETIELRGKGSCMEDLKQAEYKLKMSLDDKNDGVDVGIDEYAKTELSKGFGKDERARRKMKDLHDAIRSAMETVLQRATDEVLCKAYTQVIQRLDLLISQYEGLFDNLEQYANRLRQDAQNELVRHERTEDNRIYVGATREMKQYYYAMEADAGEDCMDVVHAAAGKGIFEAMMTRTVKKIAEDARMEKLRRVGVAVQTVTDHYTDLGSVFEEVVRGYMNYLRENAHHLNTTVIGALISQCCVEKGIDVGTIGESAANKAVFMSAFQEYMEDLKAKSDPMLRYSENNNQKYFKDERDVSERHTLLSMSENAANELLRVYPDPKNEHKFTDLVALLKLESAPVVVAGGDDYELHCFSAVHCLQPTQIHMFNEENDRSYYHYYSDRIRHVLETGHVSMSCHIDKRWHLRGAMPYISTKLEEAWRNELMKALIYEMLMREITFTRDRDGRCCFCMNRRGQPSYIYWPEGKLVMRENISRLLEYLGTFESEIPAMAAGLDRMVEYQMGELSGYTGMLPNYKAGMTKNDMLRLMRSNLLASVDIYSETTAAHGRHAERGGKDRAAERAQYQAMNQELFGDEGADVDVTVDDDMTLGGLLEVAWRIHKSEENMGEDRDYGEALLKCAQEIIDRFCRNMYGEQIAFGKGTAEYHEYVELYNHAIKKFVMEYVASTMRKRKLYDTKRLKGVSGVSLMPGAAGAFDGMEIDDSIRYSREFMWISQNWKMKDKD